MVTIKSKGGYCWHYDTGIDLDGNSLTGQFKFDKGKLTLQQVKLDVTGQWYRGIESWNKGLLIKIKRLKEKDVVRQFKLYTQVHLVKAAYTCGFTEQKERIHMHALSQQEKRAWVGKSRKYNIKEYQGSIPWYQPTILSRVTTI